MKLGKSEKIIIVLMLVLSPLILIGIVGSIIFNGLKLGHLIVEDTMDKIAGME